MVRRIFFVLVLIIALSCLLIGCSDESKVITTGTLQPVSPKDLQIVTGQIVYVPAYSEIFYDADRTIDLNVTLVIHNADLENAIIIQSVRYYNTNGELVRDYIETPVKVSPLATTGFVVKKGDASGGWGANFMVEWGAETPVYEPVIEAVMISAENEQGISMISEGRVVSQTEGQ